MVLMPLLERKNAFHLLAKKFGVLTVPLEKSSSTLLEFVLLAVTEVSSARRDAW